MNFRTFRGYLETALIHPSVHHRLALPEITLGVLVDRGSTGGPVLPPKPSMPHSPAPTDSTAEGGMSNFMSSALNCKIRAMTGTNASFSPVRSSEIKKKLERQQKRCSKGRHSTKTIRHRSHIKSKAKPVRTHKTHTHVIDID